MKKCGPPQAKVPQDLETLPEDDLHELYEKLLRKLILNQKDLAPVEAEIRRRNAE